MRLIDADVLKYVKFHGVTDWTPTEETSYQRGWNGAIDAITRNAPTVDAVPLKDYRSMEQTVNKLTKALADAEPVVRCKDCKYGIDYYHEGDCYCSNPKWGLKYFGGSWKFYCADGERREDDSK